MMHDSMCHSSKPFLVSRYVGIGKRFPALSTLGDGRWGKAKKAAETAVFDYARKAS